MATYNLNYSTLESLLDRDFYQGTNQAINQAIQDAGLLSHPSDKVSVDVESTGGDYTVKPGVQVFVDAGFNNSITLSDSGGKIISAGDGGNSVLDLLDRTIQSLDPARLARWGIHHRPDGRRLRASRRGGGDHRGAVRPRASVGFRASNDHGINPVRPAQGGTAIMPMPLRQSIRVGSYLVRQKLAGNKKFPLLVELEPLFACNLKCAGCGKIQHPHDILKQRMPVEQALAAIEECGAPMVSIAGGEPLMHPQIDVIVAELIKRKKFVFLCTNALLLPKKIDKFKPSPYFAWVVHIDGLRERHDESVCKEGVFDEAVAAIKVAKSRGFKVNTNTTFFNTDTPQTIIDVLNYLNDDLGIDEMQISPAYAYEKAPDQEHFLGVTETRELFRKAFADGRRRKWRLNHTPLFLDFLEGKTDFGCTAWGIPSYSLFGWQKPCYLMNDGYVKTYKELLETTDWDSYGRGQDPRCANCMAHCGYEPSAVLATMSSLRESIRAVRGG